MPPGNGNNNVALVPTASGTTGWSLETLYVHFTALLSDAKAVTHQRITEHEKASLYSLDAAEKTVLTAMEGLEAKNTQRFIDLEKAFIASKLYADNANNQRFIDQEKAVHAALAAAEKAVDKAEKNAELWRANANEWRSAMDDREVKFLPREEGVAGLQSNSDKISALTDRINRGEGKGAGFDAGWGYLVGAVVLIGAVVAIVLAFHK